MHKCDGHLRRILLNDIEPGTIIRMLEPELGAVSPFMDFVIVKLEDDGEYKYAHIARPYIYATQVGGHLIGCETMKLLPSQLLDDKSPFRLVMQARGNKFQYLT